MADRPQPAPNRFPLPQAARLAPGDPRLGRLTPREREAFSALGLAPGEAPPGAVGEALRQVLSPPAAGGSLEAEVRRALEEQSAGLELPVPPTTPPIDPDKVPEVAFADLPPERRAEVRARIDEMARMAREAREREASRGWAAASGVPGMAEAMAAAPAAPPPAAPPPTRAPADAGGGPADTGAAARPKACPRCAWDLSRADALEVDRADKVAWVVSLYGPQFVKSYSLMGGMVRVSFRGATAAEVDAAYRRAARDDAAARGVFLERMLEYQLCLCLESVEFAEPGGGVRRLPSPRPGVPLEGGVVDVAALRDAVLGEMLPSESLARIVRRKFGEFRRLVEWMELAADDPDFLGEAGGRP